MMNRCFVDTSALVKLYVAEVGSDQIAAIANDGEQTILISELTSVEINAALVRRSRDGSALQGELDAQLAEFDADVRTKFHVLKLDTPVLENAIIVARQYRLRAADAIQLSAAMLAAGQVLPNETGLVVVAADLELLAAAASAGMQTRNPQTEAA